MCEVRQTGLTGEVLSCQLSFYPLGREDYLSPINEVLSLIQNSGLQHTIGEASTLIYGPPDRVFALLQRITESMNDVGCRFVMPVSLSNTCGLK
jgi:uncharacterized protein YqgV (UPF0045/DUF77 family)